MAATKWQTLASTSPYQTAVGVEQALRRGDVPDATLGIQELIEALSRSDKRALRNHLTRLMAHVIKWRSQPEKRSRSWRATIRNARREIGEIREETPSLNRAFVESIWQSCFESACDDAEADMDQESPVAALSWEQVFDEDYEMD
jgi:hypothetical protein